MLPTGWHRLITESETRATVRCTGNSFSYFSFVSPRDLQADRVTVGTRRCQTAFKTHVKKAYMEMY